MKNPEEFFPPDNPEELPPEDFIPPTGEKRKKLREELEGLGIPIKEDEDK